MAKLDISEIRIGKRIRKDPGDIDEFAKNIKEYGLLAPIIVRKHNDSYKLLAGWRRIQACKKLGHKSIECIIKKVPQ